MTEHNSQRIYWFKTTVPLEKKLIRVTICKLDSRCFRKFAVNSGRFIVSLSRSILTDVDKSINFQHMFLHYQLYGTIIVSRSTYRRMQHFQSLNAISHATSFVFPFKILEKLLWTDHVSNLNLKMRQLLQSFK
jgi:hypothetical protein